MASGELPPPPRKRRHFLILSLLVILLALGGWYWMKEPTPTTGNASTGKGGGSGNKGGRGPGGGDAPQAPVVTAIAVTQDMDVIINALGTVSPTATVTIRSQIDGPLLKVHFKEGQMVNKGDLLAEIDPRPFEASLAQATGVRVRDQALLENARLDLQRYQTLLEQDATTKQQVDTQKALVHQYEGAVQSDKGSEDSARLQLGYTRITAPASGRIGLQQLDPGNMIHAADTNGLAVITTVSPINVIYTIPEDTLPAVLTKLHAGTSLPVTAWDRQLRNKLAEGVVQAVDNQIDSTTGTIKLKARFDNKDGMLFPNQFVNIRMRLEQLTHVTTVPLAAIQRGQKGTFVYLVSEDNTVKVQLVALGPDDGEHIVITEGIQPGQHVVIDGADNLREGMSVETVTPAARAAATTPAAKTKDAPTPSPGEKKRNRQPQ